MGQFGDKIFQDDKSLDVIGTIEHEGLEKAFEWLDYVDPDEDEYYELNGYLTMGAIICESYGFRVTREWYCNRGSNKWKFLDNATRMNTGKDDVERAYEFVIGCHKVLEKSKEDALQDTFDGESLYDAMGIENRVNFENMYEFLSAVISELIGLLEKCKEKSIISDDGITEAYNVLSNKWVKKMNMPSMLNCNDTVRRFGNIGFKDKLVLLFWLGQPDLPGCLSYAVKSIPGFPESVMNMFKIIAKKHMEWLTDSDPDIQNTMDMGLVEEDVTLFRQILSVREDPKDSDILVYGVESFEQPRATKEDFWSYRIPNVEAYKEFIDTSSTINDSFESIGVPVGGVSYVLCANPMVDLDRLVVCEKFMGIGRINRARFYEGMSESDSEGNSEIVSKDYDVACILVAPVGSNPLTLQALRLYVAEGIDNGELDEDEFPEEYIDILRNTPIDEPITIEAISDEKLREWDKIRYTRGSRNLLDVINEEV